MNPVVTWKTIRGKECLYFEFKGPLLETDASVAVARWKAAFHEKPSQQIVIIWNALEMTSFDTKSRLMWQKTIGELSGRMDTVWLITRSSLIRMGALMMSGFMPFKMKIVHTEDEIRF